MKKAKRKTSKTTKPWGQRKVPLGRRGRDSSGSQRRQPARLAWLERLGAYPKPRVRSRNPRCSAGRCGSTGAAGPLSGATAEKSVPSPSGPVDQVS